MNQHDQTQVTDDYNIVIGTLQKKLRELAEIQRGCDNIRWSVGGGIGMMDSIRYEQIDELSKAIKREQALVAQAAPTEPALDIADEHRTLAKWLNEEIDASIDRQALAKVLAATQCLAVKECVAGQPKKLVKLTDEEIWKLWHDLPQPTGKYAIARFANAFMDAMERKNRGQNE